jgi:hypothetical protein
MVHHSFHWTTPWKNPIRGDPRIVIDPVFSPPLVWRDEGHVRHRGVEAVLPRKTHQDGNGLAVLNRKF